MVINLQFDSTNYIFQSMYKNFGKNCLKWKIHGALSYSENILQEIGRTVNYSARQVTIRFYVWMIV